MLKRLPKRLRVYVEEHTREGSKMRKDLVEFLSKILSGEKVRYSAVKNLGIKYHVVKMKKLGLLITVNLDGVSYIAVSPDVIVEE